MQTANAMRESAVSGVRAVWYIVVYGLTTVVLLWQADWRLAVPTLAWFAGYALFLRYFVPRLRDRSKNASHLRSKVVATIVDIYANILTVKLFARPSEEDRHVRGVMQAHQDAIAGHSRITTQFIAALWLLNAMLLVGTAGVGIWLWQAQALDVAVFAMAST